MKITHEIELTEKRCCECGRFWAVEIDVIYCSTCPVCAGKAVSKAEDKVYAAERSIRAYKANLTRKKNT